MSEELVEQVRDWRGSDLAIDSSQRVVKNVVLSGANSRNGHRYTEESLRQGAGLYVKKPVFLDHATGGIRPQERSTRDLVGSITSARYEEGRIRGDIQVLGTEAGETFLELVASNTPQVGMSHVVVVERGRDPKVVETIRDVISVDAVVYPATTTTFQEGTFQGGTEVQEEKVVGEEEKFVEAEREDEDRVGREVRLERELNDARLELVVLREEQQRLLRAESEFERVQNARREVDRLLRDARLPESVVTESFRELLIEEQSVELRERLIAERRELGRRWESVKPRSVERRDGGSVRDDKWVVSLLKGRRAG